MFCEQIKLNLNSLGGGTGMYLEEKGDVYLIQSVKHGGGGIMILGCFVSTQAPAEIAEKEENAFN